VRQAIEHAIDKEAICDTIGYGYWTPVNQAAIPASWAYNPDVVGYPYNPEKSRQLLTEAGYPNGFKTTIFTMNTPAYIVSFMTANQGYLREVGIDVEMDIMDHGRFYSIFAGGGWTDGITIFPMGLSPDELGLLNRIYTPESVLFGTALKPAEFQEALARAMTSPDFETKQARTHELQKLMVDQYAMAHWTHSPSLPIPKYPEVHDDRMGIVGNEWSPEDAWLSK